MELLRVPFGRLALGWHLTAPAGRYLNDCWLEVLPSSPRGFTFIPLGMCLAHERGTMIPRTWDNQPTNMGQWSHERGTSNPPWRVVCIPLAKQWIRQGVAQRKCCRCRDVVLLMIILHQHEKVLGISLARCVLAYTNTTSVTPWGWLIHFINVVNRPCFQ